MRKMQQANYGGAATFDDICFFNEGVKKTKTAKGYMKILNLLIKNAIKLWGKNGKS